MAIGPPGVFRYSAALTRTQSGGWMGRAAPSDPARHPGLAGDQPEIEIVAGVLTLRGTEVDRVPESVTRELPGGRRFSAFLRGLGQKVHFVHRIYRWGIPGQLSQLAIVREHADVTEKIASAHITIVR